MILNAMKKLSLLTAALSLQNANSLRGSQKIRRNLSENDLYEYLVVCDESPCSTSILEAAGAAGCTVTASVLDRFGMASCTAEQELPATELEGAVILPAPQITNAPQAELPEEFANNTILSLEDLEEDRRQLADSYAPFNGQENDFFYNLQWYHEAVQDRRAWSQGIKGAGVRVAVFDDGMDYNDPDLAANLNRDLSKDYTGEGLQFTLPGQFSHGSHVSGIIGALDNGFGIIGVAPEVEIVHAKVLPDGGRGGSFGWLIQALEDFSSEEANVDVINMSLGALIPKKDPTTGQPYGGALAKLRTAVCRAVTKAKNNGVTVIVAAGNDELDLGSPDGAQFVNLLTDCSSAISISATGPRGWAIDPQNADLYQLASYSNYGVGTNIEFAGPGGTPDLFVIDGNTNICAIGTPVGTIVNFCFLFDFSFSTIGYGRFAWSVGTSMAAPAAAGVAALIISENGGPMNPNQVLREMKQRSLDFGTTGRDSVYGFGHVSF